MGRAMRPAGRSWAASLVALAAAAAVPPLAQAQTDIAKTPPAARATAKERQQAMPAAPNLEVGAEKPRARAEGWVAEVSPPAITASGAEVVLQGPRTRFLLTLSANVPYQVFTLPDPYRV